LFSPSGIGDLSQLVYLVEPLGAQQDRPIG
jgi:hypothetical protein